MHTHHQQQQREAYYKGGTRGSTAQGGQLTAHMGRCGQRTENRGHCYSHPSDQSQGQGKTALQSQCPSKQ